MSMSNTTISQALVEIEKNLEKLSTARKQVVDVTQSGEELTSLIVELTGKVDKLFQSILKESDSYNNAFLKSHQGFEQKLNTLLEKSDKSISSFQEGIQNIEPEISQKINEIADSTLDKSQRLATKQEAYFDKLIQNIETYRSTLKEFSQSITEKGFDSKFEEIDNKLSKAKEAIVSEIGTLDSNLNLLQRDILAVSKKNNEKLLELIQEQNKITSSLKDIDESNQENKEILDKSIKDLEEKQMKMNYITWALIIITFLTVIFL
tara:strand:+ start:699 stop:1490 length:792 start_codon:yes stop_codon:yes gene_type:complete